jgi:tRNA-binding EMAP/Myf-like protein
MITLEEFKKVEVRAGKILSAEKIPDTDKLLRLTVDFAETKEVAEPVDVTMPADPAVPAVPKKIVPAPRQIVSGISLYFPDPAVLVGKTCMFVTNLEPRVIKGFESNGMLFAVSDAAGNFSLLEPNNTIQPGTPAK